MSCDANLPSARSALISSAIVGVGDGVVLHYRLRSDAVVGLKL